MNPIASSNPHPSTLNPYPSPNRRERRSADIRERLFRAALRLFAGKGFAETTVEDITNAADVGKGTFFNYFPTKDHILIAFSDMQIAKLQAAVEEARNLAEPISSYMTSITLRMTEEPARSPEIIRAILQANLSHSSVRSAMRENHLRAQALLTQLFRIGQERGEFRGDIPANDLALVCRQTIVGTLLMWSVFGDATLPDRMNSALHVLWTGMMPRDLPATPSAI